MLIRLSPGQTYPAHLHEDVDEFYLVLSGSMRIQSHDIGGTNMQDVLLCDDRDLAGGTMGLLMPRNTWHATTAGDNGVVFLEVRPGPFVKGNTRYCDSMNLSHGSR